MQRCRRDRVGQGTSGDEEVTSGDANCFLKKFGKDVKGRERENKSMVDKSLSSYFFLRMGRRDVGRRGRINRH